MAVLLALLATPARAELQVRSPIVDFQEFEIEHNGLVTLGGRTADKSQSYTYELGYGVTPFWKLSMEGEMAAPPGGSLGFNAATLENIFQLTPQGEYWLDAGFFLEYSHALVRHDPSTISFGPILQKEFPDMFGIGTVHTLNLFFDKEIGPDSTGRTGMEVSWQSRLTLQPLFEPGVEIYGAIDDLGHAGTLAEQQYRIGPVVAGRQSLPGVGALKYEVGYLFGLTGATERGAVRWKLELEIPF